MVQRNFCTFAEGKIPGIFLASAVLDSGIPATAQDEPPTTEGPPRKLRERLPIRTRECESPHPKNPAKRVFREFRNPRPLPFHACITGFAAHHVAVRWTALLICAASCFGQSETVTGVLDHHLRVAACRLPFGKCENLYESVGGGTFGNSEIQSEGSGASTKNIWIGWNSRWSTKKWRIWRV